MSSPIGHRVAAERGVEASLAFAVESTVDVDYPETRPRFPVVLGRWRAAYWAWKIMTDDG